MKRLLAGVIIGLLIGGYLRSFGQVEEPITLKPPPIASDTTWTAAQRMDLQKQWVNVITQQQAINRSFAGRMRQID